MSDPIAVVAVAFQVGILLTLGVAIRRGNTSAAVNATVVLALAVLPDAIEVGLRWTTGEGVVLDPALTAWLALTGLLHSIGMLGYYETVDWWDHLTHTVSAALFAALAYAGLLVTGPWPGVPGGAATLALVYTLAVGVFWELLELAARDVGERFDVDPVLVYYGPRDTALDLVFDLAGALVVVALDVRAFVALAERYPDTTGTVLSAGAVAVCVVSLLLAVLVLGERYRPP